MTAPPPTHLRDANTVGDTKLKILSGRFSGQSPLRGALSFVTFLWASKEKFSVAKKSFQS